MLPKIVRVEAASCRCSSRCPSCQTASERVHSYYIRTRADLPCSGWRVVLELQVRTFRCRNGQCPQRLFTERFPGFVHTQGRKTDRVSELTRALGLALGGRGAQRLARLLGISVSGRTVLRLVMRDEHARRSGSCLTGRACPGSGRLRFSSLQAVGQTAGTLLMDLEQRRVIDLLPDRSLATLADWLRCHPDVQVISRDRGGDDAAAGRFGVPHAEQVADRFHVLHVLLNAGEVVER